jgi:hypothetical protein
VENPEGKIPLGGPRHRWEGNIKIDLRKIGWGGVDWIEDREDSVVWTGLICSG